MAVLVNVPTVVRFDSRTIRYRDPNAQRPTWWLGVVLTKRCLAMTYSRVRSCTLPLALARFTAEFGKGSGGTTPLWSPSIGKVMVR